MSWAEAGSLRTRTYELQEKLEVARTALEDIGRIEDLQLIKEVALRALEQLS